MIPRIAHVLTFATTFAALVFAGCGTEPEASESFALSGVATEINAEGLAGSVAYLSNVEGIDVRFLFSGHDVFMMVHDTEVETGDTIGCRLEWLVDEPGFPCRFTTENFGPWSFRTGGLGTDSVAFMAVRDLAFPDQRCDLWGSWPRGNTIWPVDIRCGETQIHLMSVDILEGIFFDN